MRDLAGRDDVHICGRNLQAQRNEVRTFLTLN
jgi:hypothetical protein